MAVPGLGVLHRASRVLGLIEGRFTVGRTTHYVAVSRNWEVLEEVFSAAVQRLIYKPGISMPMSLSNSLSIYLPVYRTICHCYQ